jgi:hypothetical protein
MSFIFFKILDSHFDFTQSVSNKSAQSGEVPYERVLEGFTITAHEPYYMDYTRTNLPELFEENGLLVKDSSGTYFN